MLTDIEKAQAAASAAMDAAKMASDNANTAADDAEAKVMGIAAIQTGEMSKMYAMQAREAANMAMTEYMNATAESEAANAADATLLVAVEGKVKAEAAKMAADGHAEMAVEKGTMAEERAAMELKIVGKTKSVGDDTSITIDGMTHSASVTTNGVTVTTNTGKTGNVTAMSTAVAAVEAAAAIAADPPRCCGCCGDCEAGGRSAAYQHRRPVRLDR